MEDAAGIRGLVLELVEGDTLADRVQLGAVRVPDVVRIARQLVDALDAAHERGIVHRDLKPANIKITDEHTIKVLDFGLAKAIADPGDLSDPALSPTITSGGTRDGVILGTAAYMSPEQARGRAVDKRADIWAFGCVVNEKRPELKAESRKLEAEIRTPSGRRSAGGRAGHFRSTAGTRTRASLAPARDVP